MTREIDRNIYIGLIHYAEKFSPDGLQNFIDNIGYEDWMDEFFEDEENPTEQEMEEIDRVLRRAFNAAHRKNKYLLKNYIDQDDDEFGNMYDLKESLERQGISYEEYVEYEEKGDNYEI